MSKATETPQKQQSLHCTLVSFQYREYEYHIFLLLNFLRPAILNIYEVKWLPNCCIQQNVDCSQ